MCAVAYLVLSQNYGLSYVPFFGGFIEISGIPLTVVDVFHPTHYEARPYPCSFEFTAPIAGLT